MKISVNLLSIIEYHAPLKTKRIHHINVHNMNSERRKLNFQRRMTRYLKKKYSTDEDNIHENNTE